MKKRLLLLIICYIVLLSAPACKSNQISEEGTIDEVVQTEAVSTIEPSPSLTLSPTPSPTPDIPSMIEAMLPKAPISASEEAPSDSMISDSEKAVLVEFLTLIYTDDLETAYDMIYNDKSGENSFMENPIEIDNATIVTYSRNDTLGWTVAFGYNNQRRHRTESWLIWVKEDQNGGYIDSYMYMYLETK